VLFSVSAVSPDSRTVQYLLADLPAGQTLFSVSSNGDLQLQRAPLSSDPVSWIFRILATDDRASCTLSSQGTLSGGCSSEIFVKLTLVLFRDCPANDIIIVTREIPYFYSWVPPVRAAGVTVAISSNFIAPYGFFDEGSTSVCIFSSLLF